VHDGNTFQAVLGFVLWLPFAATVFAVMDTKKAALVALLFGTLFCKRWMNTLPAPRSV
jgi:hypothetical protein